MLASSNYASCMGDSILSDNIAALRASFGDNQVQFASRIGAQQTYVSKWENGMEPSARPLHRMAKLAGRDLEQFMDEPWRPGDDGEEVPHGPTPKMPANDDNVVEVRSLNLAFSMGPGSTIDDYIEETPYRFDLGFIRTFTRTETNMLRLARGVGESMFPTLLSSDLVWIDQSQRILNQQDRIWAISLFGAAAIKRLRTIGKGKVLVISDNPNVDNQEVDAKDLIIGGRVIRLGRDL